MCFIFCHTFKLITSEIQFLMENGLILKFGGDYVLSVSLRYLVGSINMSKHASQTGSAA